MPSSGKMLAYTCHGCHGMPNYKNAYPNYSVPRLGGQNATYLANALKAYATGERPHPTMHSQAATLSEQDSADIAAYLQSEVVQPGKQVVGTPPPATQTCVTCHGTDGAKTWSVTTRSSPASSPTTSCRRSRLQERQAQESDHGRHHQRRG